MIVDYGLARPAVTVPLQWPAPAREAAKMSIRDDPAADAASRRFSGC